MDTTLCEEGVDEVFADAGDTIGDATSANPNGSCETVHRSA